MSCNGSSLREALSRALAIDADESTAKSKRKADIEKWASLLAIGVAQVSAAPNSELGAAPEAWRTDVGPMTPPPETRNVADETAGSLESSAASSTSAPAEVEENRVQVRVNVAELGELALLVERSDEGVKVQISAQDRRILDAMVAEREALTAALSAAGHSLTTLAFVEMDSVGTNLAQSKTNPSAQARMKREGKSANPSTPQVPKRSQRLNVIG